MADQVPWWLAAQNLADERLNNYQQYQLGRETQGQYNALLRTRTNPWGGVETMYYPGLPPLRPTPPPKTFSGPLGDRPNPAYQEWEKLAAQYREAAERPSPLLANEAYANETQRLSALSGLLNK
jgi:hypothetical protein